MTRNQDKARERCAHIAKALDLTFVRGYGDDTLTEDQIRARQATHVLFRDHADGTITFAACGLLPSEWRVRPNKALLERFDAYLEAIGATRRADFIRKERMRIALEAAKMEQEARASTPPVIVGGRCPHGTIMLPCRSCEDAEGVR
jgi:hypothetical protein